jgi:hypothetical protein
MADVTLYPIWKEAVNTFIGTVPQPGDIITEEWRCLHFGIKKPTTGTAESFTKYDLEMLSAFDSFRRELLEQHLIHLKSIGKGQHVVLAAKDQTTEAWQKGLAGVKSSIQKMHSELTHVDHTQLSSEERKENTDKQAKLSFLSTMVRKAKRLRISSVADL